MVECFPARMEVVRRHPWSERGGYPKPGRIVSVVLDRVVVLDNLELSA